MQTPFWVWFTEKGGDEVDGRDWIAVEIANDSSIQEARETMRLSCGKRTDNVHLKTIQPL